MRIALAFAALLLVGACSTDGTSQSGKADYKTAKTLPSLDIPPDLSAPSRDGRYELPEGAKSATTLSGYQAGRTMQAAPGTSSVLPAAQGMRVERDGSQRWLVVNEPPEKLWPLLREFWQENGFLLRLEQAELGIMETDWAENRATLSDSWLTRTLGGLLRSAHGTDERDKYRTRLERTPTGGTEVYISHRGMEQVYSDGGTRTDGPLNPTWQPRPADPELEVEFLRRLMVRLGTPSEKAQALVATAQPPQRATLKKGLDGNELLEVLDPFDRAWRRVGLALDRVGFTVEDRDRQKGVYFVRYADPEADMSRKSSEKSMFSWLAFWRDDGPKVKAEQYRVAVVGETETSRVQVLDKTGAAESSPTSRRILTLLHEQLR
ncbi:MAG TPA: outer membrane protein assembly factor BamC [Burkholderiales bacterium]|nr:outer membrane protein assembly factor BamC [Burkholderiales bacterium]